MRWILVIAVLMGASSVIFGAAFQHIGVAEGQQTLQTALRYHQIHSVVLLALGLYSIRERSNKPVMISAALLVAGTAIFSLSLYAMVLLNFPVLGMLTPIGGSLLIAGWISLLFIKPVRYL